MTEKQFVEKLNKLSEIKPRQEWVVLTKKSILGEEVTVKARFAGFVHVLMNVNYRTKLAYSFATLLIIFAGFFGFETMHMASVAKNDESSKYNFELANKKLEELAAEAMNNTTQNKTAVINEFKASLADAAKSLVASAKKNPKAVNDIVAEAKRIKENAVLLDKIDGTDNESSVASDDLYKTIDQDEIKALETASLTDEQQKTLTEIKDLFEAGKYSDAFEKILTINN